MMSSKRLFVRISTSKGESVRRLLLESGFLDIECKIISENGFLFLPLRENTSLSSVERILSEHEIETGEKGFHLISQGPKTLEEVLQDQLPAEKLTLLPRAYDMVGDIAVLELPHELGQYEQVIGRAFQSIHKSFATILIKRGAITGVTRTRKYDLLAGIDKTNTIHTEYGVRISVDLAAAYFSPRLLEEHHRVSVQVKEGDSVVDLFTGVGPFALHIAKRCNAIVTAVDINPEAIRLLEESMKLNRLIGSIIPIASDAHSFAQSTLSESVDRVIMNHPSGAADFVPDACRILRSGGILHYYDFMGGENPILSQREKVTKLIENAGRGVSEITTIRRVRDSAPYEYQMVADVTLQ